MKTLACLLILFAVTPVSVRASSDHIVTVYQPLGAEDGLSAHGVPVIMSGASYPEKVYQAIIAPYIPPQYTYHKVGNINLAYSAGLSLKCKARGDEGKMKITLEFDFAKADPKLVNGQLIKVLLDCIAKTEPRKNVILYSRMANAEKFTAFVKQIEAKIPPEAHQEKKESNAK